MKTTDQRRVGSLPASTSVGQVQLRVADLERSLGFYQDFLGFHHVERDGSVARIGTGPAGPYLFQLREVPGAGPAPRRAAGLYHAAILLPSRPDLARVARHLLAHRYPFGQSDHAVSEALYLDDPDGNGLEIYADRPRDAWPKAGDEVRMTLDPIDFEDLFSELEGDRDIWTGMPTGTTVGHVHLRVSDLDASRRFYVDMLGFDLMQEMRSSALFVSAGGYHHHLGMNVWESRGRPLASDDVAGLDSFAITVPDKGSLETLTQRVGSAAQANGDLAVKDPDGITVRLRHADSVVS